MIVEIIIISTIFENTILLIYKKIVQILYQNMRESLTKQGKKVNV